MPPTTTEQQYVLGIKQTGGTAAQSNLILFNRRTRERVVIRTTSNEAKTNLGNSKVWSSGFQNTDVIDVSGFGLKTGSNTHIVNTKLGWAIVTVTMVDASTTNAPAVAIG